MFKSVIKIEFLEDEILYFLSRLFVGKVNSEKAIPVFEYSGFIAIRSEQAYADKPFRLSRELMTDLWEIGPLPHVDFLESRQRNTFPCYVILGLIE